jgi:hypothetical protein
MIVVSVLMFTFNDHSANKKITAVVGALLSKSVSNRDCNADGDEDVEPVDLWE